MVRFLIFAIGYPQDRHNKTTMLAFGRRKRRGGIPMTVTNRCTHLVRAVLGHLLPGTVAVLFACAAAAQNAPALQPGAAGEPQQQAVPSPDVAPPQPDRPNRPGLLGAIGRWLDDSIGGVAAGMSSARDSVGNIGAQATDVARGAATAARDAAATVTRIPAGSLVSGRAHCLRTAGGGPDCVAATEVLCRAKGFTTGTSIHIQSEQKCPVRGWIKGEQTVGRCGTETYVTSAMCR
jgi:hypothetical protein